MLYYIYLLKPDIINWIEYLTKGVTTETQVHTTSLLGTQKKFIFGKEKTIKFYAEVKKLLILWNFFDDNIHKFSQQGF